MAEGRGGWAAAWRRSCPSRRAPASELRDLPVAQIRPVPTSRASGFDSESITALARSIADAGVVQPLIVRPLADGRYELIAGERRWRAAREARLEMVPALVRDEDEPRRLQIALIENVARENLNPVDEARACATLIDDLGLSKEELARRLGRTRSAVSNLIRLLDLPGRGARAARRSAGSARGTGGRSCRRRRRRCGSSWPAVPRPRDGRCARPSAGRSSRRREAQRRSCPTPTRRPPLSGPLTSLEQALGMGVRVTSSRRGTSRRAPLRRPRPAALVRAPDRGARAPPRIAGDLPTRPLPERLAQSVRAAL